MNIRLPEGWTELAALAAFGLYLRGGSTRQIADLVGRTPSRCRYLANLMRGRVAARYVDLTAAPWPDRLYTPAASKLSEQDIETFYGLACNMLAGEGRGKQKAGQRRKKAA